VHANLLGPFLVFLKARGVAVTAHGEHENTPPLHHLRPGHWLSNTSIVTRNGQRETDEQCRQLNAQCQQLIGDFYHCLGERGPGDHTPTADIETADRLPLIGTRNILFRSVPWAEISDSRDTSALEARCRVEGAHRLKTEKIPILEGIESSFSYYDQIRDDLIGLLDDLAFVPFAQTFFIPPLISDIPLGQDTGILSVIAPARLAIMTEVFASIDARKLHAAHKRKYADEGPISANAFVHYVEAIGIAAKQCAEKHHALIILIN
jgi:hypothetical protein